MKSEATNTKRRGSYTKYSREVRKRIIDAYKNDEDWSYVARCCGVKYQTAYHWIKFHDVQPVVKDKSGRKKILSEVEIDEIAEWISEDSKITLDEIRARIYTWHKKSVSISTIGRSLKDRMIANESDQLFPSATL